MKDFEDALAFVERVAGAAVDYHRRPDMCIFANNRVRLSIANLHHAGFTIAEIRLARKVTDPRRAPPRGDVGRRSLRAARTRPVDATDDRGPVRPVRRRRRTCSRRADDLAIFGATGDLASRKLLPTLYNLAHEGALPERFNLVGSRAAR